ncbi:hypothetical protein [Sphingobacterium olei]|uniref:hypothetical protein n=1 Tax=Sphingobacterium olei TaxID=2571155 RepID=UPI001390199B|nr:hypothetical protein [Sphingobacterium olei]
MEAQPPDPTGRWFAAQTPYERQAQAATGVLLSALHGLPYHDLGAVGIYRWRISEKAAA